MKVLVNLISCFLPTRKMRREFRNKYEKSVRRRKKLLQLGCTLDANVAITPDHIRFDISDAAKVCAHIEEIFFNKTYSLDCGQKAVVVDIGMNRGVASLYFAAQPNVVRVYAFEPFRPTLELAEKNLALNPELKEKIKVFPWGLGGDEATLQIPYSVNASDSMSTTHDVPVRKDVRVETVIVKDAAAVLSPMLQEHADCRILIKCDCEGAEFDIIRRLREEKLISRIDAVLMEYHFDRPDELIDVFVENGFAVHAVQGSNDPIVGYLYAVKMQDKQSV